MRNRETGLDYFGARYFSGAQGRFTSPDPLNIANLQRLSPARFQSVIVNPQNWNAYGYAHNNPLAKLDPDGFLTIVVPGTWNDNEKWKKSRFVQQVQKAFNEKDKNMYVVPNNNMGNDPKSRAAAAKLIADTVRNHTFEAGEKLNIVAHSHGVNAAFTATQMGLGRTVDNLVTLGTPIRFRWGGWRRRTIRRAESRATLIRMRATW